MPLTSQQKSYLTTHKTSIETSFDKFKALKTHMGVYFDTQRNNPYITFSMADDFSQPSLRFAGKTYMYCCTFVTANDFNTQYNAFLA